MNITSKLLISKQIVHTRVEVEQQQANYINIKKKLIYSKQMLILIQFLRFDEILQQFVNILMISVFRRKLPGHQIISASSC